MVTVPEDAKTELLTLSTSILSTDPQEKSTFPTCKVPGEFPGAITPLVVTSPETVPIPLKVEFESTVTFEVMDPLICRFPAVTVVEPA